MTEIFNDNQKRQIFLYLSLLCDPSRRLKSSDLQFLIPEDEIFYLFKQGNFNQLYNFQSSNLYYLLNTYFSSRFETRKQILQIMMREII